MNIKEEILELFELNRGIYFSGEDIAKKLSVSRAAVWKAVKALQHEGYAIDAVTNKGYCLSERTDIISARGINKYLNIKSDIDISVLPIADTTNGIVKEKAISGAAEGYFVIANEQTKGRGRLGRSFYSPKGSGLYMSLLLRPNNYSAEQAIRITTMAAVAMSEAIEALSDEKAEIKWVNDIYVRGKKVCGILTEGSFNLESGMLEYAILGVGINVYEPDDGFPMELNSIAGAVFKEHKSDVKNRLTAEFLNRFYGYYTAPCQTEYAEQYRSRSFVIGKQVTLLSASESKNAVVIGIDDNCHLLVKFPDGSEGCFSSGEISVRV